MWLGLRILAFAVGVVAVGSLVGCAPIPWCTRGHYFNHPTMTPDDMTFGNEARVRTTTEGATGTLASGW